jgi:hypothetical protein
MASTDAGLHSLVRNVMDGTRIDDALVLVVPVVGKVVKIAPDTRRGVQIPENVTAADDGRSNASRPGRFPRQHERRPEMQRDRAVRGPRDFVAHAPARLLPMPRGVASVDLNRRRPRLGHSATECPSLRQQRQGLLRGNPCPQVGSTPRSLEGSGIPRF